MKVPKVWTHVLYLLLFADLIRANIDSKEYFCGKKLAKTLTELCSIYNNPTFGPNRFRRQIVDECCRSQCSRRYLVQYYCLEANSSILNLLKTKPEEPPKVVDFDKDTKHYQSDSSGSSGVPALQEKVQERSSLNRIKKSRQVHSNSLIRKIERKPVPPANIGHIENSQKPFYVWRFSRVF